jgi:hypothetical protein
LLASASAGDEGAIAYAELEALDDGGSFTRTRIKLQRLDGMGATRGSAVDLGVVESDRLSGLTLATDGKRYIACWADDAQIACARAPVGQGTASPGQSMAGVSPSLAYSSGTWALAYGVPGSLAIVPLASDGIASGTPVLFESGEDPYFNPLILLAATNPGFVLVGGDNVLVRPLDFAFSPIANPIDLGVTPWAYGAIAASETSVAVSLAKPYGSNLFLFNDGVLTDTQPFGGGGKLGLRVALTTEETSFGMLMPNFQPNGGGGDPLLYQRIEEGVPALAQAQEADFGLLREGPRPLLWLKDDVFLAATQSFPGEEIVVARVHRP